MAVGRADYVVRTGEGGTVAHLDTLISGVVLCDPPWHTES